MEDPGSCLLLCNWEAPLLPQIFQCVRFVYPQVAPGTQIQVCHQSGLLITHCLIGFCALCFEC